MTADVMHSPGLDPRSDAGTIPGFQAWCPMHPDGDTFMINGVWTENVWMGAWHQNWIDARLDAVAHNMVKHPWSYAPLPANWSDI